MRKELQRTWAEIDLDALAHNYSEIRSRMRRDCLFMAVVKANAYGHGVEKCVPTLDRLGADWFAVSNIGEALEIRALGIKKPILILGYTPAECAVTLAENNISQAVYSLDYGRELSAAAKTCGVSVKAHIKIDTGMGRIGFDAVERLEDSVSEIYETVSLPSIVAEGLFTHFAVADEADGGAYTDAQFERFCRVDEALRAKGVTFALRHCCNSAATLTRAHMQLDMCRPGIILYGLMPSAEVNFEIDLRPVMSLKSVVSYVKTVGAGRTVSYGRKFCAQADTVVATVPVGYADGYSRSNSQRGVMCIGGHEVPVIGRVCMDQTMLDVTALPSVKRGDIVTVMGRDGDAHCTADDLARLCGTINYEITCDVGHRVPRIYFSGGKETE